MFEDNALKRLLFLAVMLVMSLTACTDFGDQVLPQLMLTDANKTSLSDTEIAQILIARSIVSYSKSCPCPYNKDIAGSKCGGRSAYSRKGEASPLCYRHDVTQDMLRDYKFKMARSEVALSYK